MSKTKNQKKPDGKSRQVERLLYRALDILEDISHPDELCEFDHHGYCQTHGWFYNDIECPNSRALKLLKECSREV